MSTFDGTSGALATNHPLFNPANLGDQELARLETVDVRMVKELTIHGRELTPELLLLLASRLAPSSA